MRSEADMRAVAALLDWYREMGVDTAVEDTPQDWLARGDVAPGRDFRLSAQETDQPSARHAPDIRSAPLAPAAREPSRPPLQRPVPQRQAPASDARPGFSPKPPDAAELAARSAAKNAPNLEALETALRGFDGCGLKATAKNLCFYRGAAKARLMIIGEAPGSEEDREGRPFVGRAGQLLDKMLAAIALKEQDVHITNVVYWRPPGNRTPTPQETQVCKPFLERQMELVEPDAVLLLGGAAAKHMLDVTDGIMRVRGKWREIQIGSRTVKAMATLHPAYLLRTPAAKRHAWRDLLAVQAILENR